MDVPTLSTFLMPILTVTSVWNTGETGNMFYLLIILLIVPSSIVFNVFLYSGTADTQPHKIPLGKYF